MMIVFLCYLERNVFVRKWDPLILCLSLALLLSSSWSSSRSFVAFYAATNNYNLAASKYREINVSI